MIRFREFFGSSPDDTDKQDKKSEQEKAILEKRREIIVKLNAFDLSIEGLEKLTSEEIVKLEDEIHILREELKHHHTIDSFEEEHEVIRPSEAVVNVTDLESPSKDDDIISYLNKLNDDCKRFFKKLFDYKILDLKIAEKFKEYDKTNWKQVMKEKLDSAITPFGSGMEFVVNYYKEKGINLENPTSADAERYFEDLTYHGGSIIFELHRRLNAETPLSKQERADVYELFNKLFEKPDGKGWLQALVGEEKEQKIEWLGENLPK